MLAKQLAKDKEIYCTAEMPLTEVFKRMTEIGCACMPVVESPNHRNVIGTITEHDICQKLINGGLIPHRTSAGRVMNANFATISSEATVEECVRRLKLAAVERLFVVDENGAFMGILTEAELAPVNTVVSLETVISDLSTPRALPSNMQLAH